MALILNSMYVRLRRRMERLPALKRAIWIAAELKNYRPDRPEAVEASMEALFRLQPDPYRFARDAERARFEACEQMLRRAGNGRPFAKAWEIGCAEGVFTRRLAPLCNSLLAVDVSGVALERARDRCRDLHNVSFQQWELQTAPPDSQFDLIVATGVLEYLRRPATFDRVRSALVNALVPGGVLLVGTTILDALEGSWWARRMLRSSDINRYVGEHPHLQTIASERGQFGLPFLHTLYTKINPVHARAAVNT